MWVGWCVSQLSKKYRTFFQFSNNKTISRVQKKRIRIVRHVKNRTNCLNSILTNSFIVFILSYDLRQKVQKIDNPKGFPSIDSFFGVVVLLNIMDNLSNWDREIDSLYYIDSPDDHKL